MTVNELIIKHGFNELSVSAPEREIEGCYIGDLLSWVMGKAKADNVWITIMNNINTLAVASLSDVSLIILAENVQVDEDIVEAASARGINVVSSPLSAYEIAVRIQADV